MFLTFLLFNEFCVNVKNVWESPIYKVKGKEVDQVIHFLPNHCCRACHFLGGVKSNSHPQVSGRDVLWAPPPLLLGLIRGCRACSSSSGAPGVSCAAVPPSAVWCRAPSPGSDRKSHCCVPAGAGGFRLFAPLSRQSVWSRRGEARRRPRHPSQSCEILGLFIHRGRRTREWLGSHPFAFLC